VTIGGIEFDNNFYDREVDILYLHVGKPSDAVDFSDTDEGDHSRYAADGSLIGLTILNPRLRLEKDGRIELTLRDRMLVVTDLGDVLQ
jgi:uncharacterized protein YuzE